MAKKSKQEIMYQKNIFLKALTKNLGNLSTTLKATGIAKSTYYDWLRKDPEFKAEAFDVKETAIDFVESKLFSQINVNNTTATIFYLKCHAGHRGYVENQVIHNYNRNLNVDMTAEERQAIVDEVRNSEDEFEDYE